MFYSIYLFTSLILICNVCVNSNETSSKINWKCADEKCETPLSEFETTQNYHLLDHKDKLIFNLKDRGKIYKKTRDKSGYWFVEIKGKRGYVDQNIIRETKLLNKPTLDVEGDYPFSISSGAEEKIRPSQPKVVEGTTLTDDFIDIESVTTPDSNSAETTPPLNSKDVETQSLKDESKLTRNLGDGNVGIQSGLDDSETSKNGDAMGTTREGLLDGSFDSGAQTQALKTSSETQDDGVSIDVIEEVVTVEDEAPVPEEPPSVNELQSETKSDFTERRTEDVKLSSKLSTGSVETDYTSTESPNQNVDSSISNDSFGVSESAQKISVESIDKYYSTESPKLHSESGDVNASDPVQNEVPSNDVQQNSVDKVEPPQQQFHPSYSYLYGKQPPVPVTDNVQLTVDEVENSFNSSVESVNPSSNTEQLSTAETKESLSQNYVVQNPKDTSFLSTPPPVEMDNTRGTTDDNLTGKLNEASSSAVPPSTTTVDTNDSIKPNFESSSQTDEVSSQLNDARDSTGETPSVYNIWGSNAGKSYDVPTLSESISETPSAKNSWDSNTGKSSDVPPLSESTSETPPATGGLSDDSIATVPPLTESTGETLPVNGGLTDDTSTILSPSSESSGELSNADDVIPKEEETFGIYSSMFSIYTSFSEMFAKSDFPSGPIKEPRDQVVEETISSKTAPHGYCTDGFTCGGLESPIGGEDQVEYHWSHQNYVEELRRSFSLNSIMCMCIMSVVVLVFSLGYYYIDKSHSSSTLVARVNQLSQELFMTKKERDTLEDRLMKVEENCNLKDFSNEKQESMVSSLQAALKESESTRGQLEETVVRLEKEVETLMEQGLEMHKLLAESLSDEERTQMLLTNIDELKESLNEKLNEIISLSAQLDNKNKEMQLAQIDLRNSNDRVVELERKMDTCRVETEESFTRKMQDLQQQIIKLQQVVEEKGVSIAKLEGEVAKTKAERDSAEARAISAEQGLQSAHSVGGGEARKAWLEATEVRAALVNANTTNQTLQADINQINSTNQTLLEKINSLNEELSSLNSKYESVEKDKVNALTKLQVLSDYFKEKESKLQEELGVKESQWLQKESEDHTIYEQMKSLREEIASYKAQNDKLKSEILEQEASYKAQIANEQEKYYNNWTQLRQAERKVSELQMEASHYRNKLTQMETSGNQSASNMNPNGLDKSSYGAPSPPFMMLPPRPSAEFYPPHLIHPSASRPPPLGRISSPQLSGEMIPPPPLLPLEMLPPLPPSSTPPPPLPLYKPLPRDRPPPPSKAVAPSA